MSSRRRDAIMYLQFEPHDGRIEILEERGKGRECPASMGKGTR